MTVTSVKAASTNTILTKAVQTNTILAGAASPSTATD
jgi:hypothetical protein